MTATHPVEQLRADGRLRHLLTLKGVPAPTLMQLMDAAEA